MNRYYSCQSKSIFIEVASGGGATDNPYVLTTAGSSACLRTFDAYCGAPHYQNISIAPATPAFLYIEKMDASNTEILKMQIPKSGTGSLINLGGGSSDSVYTMSIPGPGLLSRDGLRARITIPANSGTGPIFACVNLVYSV